MKRLELIISFLIFFLFIGSAYPKNFSQKQAFSQKQVLPAPPLPVITPNPNPTTTVSTVQRDSSDLPPARFRLAPALGIQNSMLGYGGMAEMTFSTGAPFFIGIESGYLQFQGQNQDGSGNTKIDIIPVLVSLSYRFNLERGSVHPYLGVALGVSISNGSTTSDAYLAPATDTQSEFMALGRPGVEFQLSRSTSFFVEPQVGVMKTHFVFVPQAGLGFNF